MPIVVRAVSEEEFKDWAAKQKADASVTAADAPVQLAAAATSTATDAAAGPVDGNKVYDGLCAACHAGGIAGAPKVGDKAGWKARIAQGDATLYEHAIKGIRGMPAKGGNPALSDAEVKAAVDLMVAQSK